MEEDTTVEIASQDSFEQTSDVLRTPLPPNASEDTIDRIRACLLHPFAAAGRQKKSLNRKECTCVETIKKLWEANHAPLESAIYLHFARFYEFNVRKASKGLRNFDQRYLTLTVSRIGPMLQSKALFPVRGLTSIDGLDMFYMRPSRYSPKQIPTKYIIDNLAYVMLTMIEKEENSINGIGFLACMDEWTMENFSIDYCYQFMMMLQGGVPARVELFLIINPPSWFGAIWKIMKPMLHRKFRRKVKMIAESELPHFLAPGYETFLPDEMATGQASTKQIVRDFVAYRRQVEQSRTG